MKRLKVLKHEKAKTVIDLVNRRHSAHKILKTLKKDYETNDLVYKSINI